MSLSTKHCTPNTVYLNNNPVVSIKKSFPKGDCLMKRYRKFGALVTGGGLIPGTIGNIQDIAFGAKALKEPGFIRLFTFAGRRKSACHIPIAANNPSVRFLVSERLSQELSSLGTKDLAFLYFTGHGAKTLWRTRQVKFLLGSGVLYPEDICRLSANKKCSIIAVFNFCYSRKFAEQLSSPFALSLANASHYSKGFNLKTKNGVSKIWDLILPVLYSTDSFQQIIQEVDNYNSLLRRYRSNRFNAFYIYYIA